MITLSPEQCRVVGVMLEKETTTPEQYPLSLNAITTACNQKSNRDPVMSISESEVQQLLDSLTQMNQLMIDAKASTRVEKYFHRFCNTEFGNLQFSAQQRAIICVLLLRGAQTPGELRNRTNRLASFTDVKEVEVVLSELQDLKGQVLVKKLPREPGKREYRFVHLFTDQDLHSLSSAEESEGDNLASLSKVELAQKVTELEQQVAALEQKLSLLNQQSKLD